MPKIVFMISTGFRIYDCLDLTIGEYMEATSDFHDFVEVVDNNLGYLIGVDVFIIERQIIFVISISYSVP